MNLATATAWLRLRLQPDSEPTLDPHDLGQLLALAAQPDVDGVDPTDAAWEPTYGTPGLYRAAQEGWRIKAGKAAGGFDFTTDGQTFRRSQVVDHCEAQATLWGRKLARSIPLTGAT